MRCALALLAIAALAACVNAHNGAFHETTPETSNYVRSKVAFCTKFVPITADAVAKSKAAPGTAAALPKAPAAKLTAKAPPAGVTITGNATVWQYLYKNLTCNLSAGIQINAVFTQNGKPLVGHSMTGRTHTSKCADGAGSRFYFDPKGNLSDPANPLWWGAGKTNKTGAALGNGANDGTINLASPNAPRSLVIYDDASAAPYLCCDLIPQGALTTDWSKKTLTAPGAKPCPATGDPDHGPAAHGAGAHGAHGAGAHGAAEAKPAASPAAKGGAAGAAHNHG